MAILRNCESDLSTSKNLQILLTAKLTSFHVFRYISCELRVVVEFNLAKFRKIFILDINRLTFVVQFGTHSWTLLTEAVNSDCRISVCWPRKFYDYSVVVSVFLSLKKIAGSRSIFYCLFSLWRFSVRNNGKPSKAWKSSKIRRHPRLHWSNNAHREKDFQYYM